MYEEPRPEICRYCNSFVTDKRAQIDALHRVAYLARVISGNATMTTHHGGGIWTVTQSTMTSLRTALDCLDQHSA